VASSCCCSWQLHSCGCVSSARNIRVADDLTLAVELSPAGGNTASGCDLLSLVCCASTSRSWAKVCVGVRDACAAVAAHHTGQKLLQTEYGPQKPFVELLCGWVGSPATSAAGRDAYASCQRQPGSGRRPGKSRSDVTNLREAVPVRAKSTSNVDTTLQRTALLPFLECEEQSARWKVICLATFSTLFAPIYLQYSPTSPCCTCCLRAPAALLSGALNSQQSAQLPANLPEMSPMDFPPSGQRSSGRGSPGCTEVLTAIASLPGHPPGPCETCQMRAPPAGTV